MRNDISLLIVYKDENREIVDRFIELVEVKYGKDIENNNICVHVMKCTDEKWEKIKYKFENKVIADKILFINDYLNRYKFVESFSKFGITYGIIDSEHTNIFIEHVGLEESEYSVFYEELIGFNVKAEHLLDVRAERINKIDRDGINRILNIIMSGQNNRKIARDYVSCLREQQLLYGMYSFFYSGLERFLRMV